MQKNDVYRTETDKSCKQFVEDLAEVVKRYDFIINNAGKTDMATVFAAHGAEIADGFDLQMIQLCKPKKAAKSLGMNPERSILIPKFIMAFSGNGKTQIRFLRFGEEDIKSVVQGDDKFPGSLAETYKTIVAMIDEAK